MYTFLFQGILVLAATNRPFAIDAALMRPGRFDLVRTNNFVPVVKMLEFSYLVATLNEFISGNFFY